MRLPVTLQLRRSASLTFAQVGAHALVGLALIPVSMPLLAKIALWAALGFSLLYVLRPCPFISLSLKADGRLELTRRDGVADDCRPLPATTVFARLVILVAKRDQGIDVLVLPTDALGREGHRQLRLWLRWKADAAAMA
jgi:hypothetical protein